MEKSKLFWSKLAMINLAIVALLGFTLRTKILFPIPAIDYRNVLSAHSHFAFSGWAGLALTMLLIYQLLPAPRRFYQGILLMMEVTSLGMAFSFPFQGYGFWSILFSSTYILTNYVFAFVFLKELVKATLRKEVKWLAIAAVVSLLISAIGPLGLVYLLVYRTGDSILYRDLIYTFLHFQYNGFFTLSVFALFLQSWLNRGFVITGLQKKFTWFLIASVVPTVFLSLLWHNSVLFYVLGILGCILLISTFYFFVRGFQLRNIPNLFANRIAGLLLLFSLFSFTIKLLLSAGTIFPSLGNAVYGDRPVIIGFLHMVFLAFVSFFILSKFTEDGLFTQQGRLARIPLIVFISGVFLNEGLLMAQGLGILLKTNNQIYNWLLWIAAIILLAGGIMMAMRAVNKKASPERDALFPG